MGRSNGWDMLFGLAMIGAIFALIPTLLFYHFYQDALQSAASAPAYDAACKTAGVATSGSTASDSVCVWQPANATSLLQSHADTRLLSTDRQDTYQVTLLLTNLNCSVQEFLHASINGPCYAQMWRGKVMTISATGIHYPTEDNPDSAAGDAENDRQAMIDFFIWWIVSLPVAILLRVGPMRRLSADAQNPGCGYYWAHPFNSYGTNNWDMLYALAIVGTVIGLICTLYVRAEYQTANLASADIQQYHADCDKAGVVGYGGVTLDAPCEWEPAISTFHTIAIYNPGGHGSPGSYTYRYYASLDLTAHNDAMQREYLPSETPINGHCYAQMWQQDKIMMIEANGVRYQTGDNPNLQAKPAGNLRAWLVGLTIATSLFAALAAFLFIGPGRSLRGRVGIPWSQPAYPDPSQPYPDPSQPVTPKESQQPPRPDYWNDP